MSSTKVVAFLQLYNEEETGHLIRCLTNCQSWADEIFIYDDGSTDNSREVYREFTDEKNIIFGGENDFKSELAHKEALLHLALRASPDWIGGIDGDDSLDRDLTKNLRERLSWVEESGGDGVILHNMNLWKNESFYRRDNHFNDLKKVNFWKNTGKLCYMNTSPGLHRPQHPDGLECLIELPANRLLHYGFASREWIIQKYLTYKGLGQRGWALDRLIDEMSSFELAKVPLNAFPIGQVPNDWHTVETPQAETYNEIRRWHNYQEYLDSLEN